MNQELHPAAESYTGLEIAVIGMSGRFPGAPDIEQFWQNLKLGIESISFFSYDELKAIGIDDDFLKHPGYVAAYGWLEGIDEFDAAFFGYSPLEAEIMDPQMRIFHETVLAGLENAGIDPFSYSKPIGLYAGGNGNFFWQARVELAGKNEIMGHFTSKQFSDKDFSCTRIAHRLNLKGPALAIDTACSTSLVTIHMACQGLISGDCDIAAAGGVSIGASVKGGYIYQEGMLGSPDGHCRAFDVQAQGTNFGNASGIVVLKRYEEAVAEHDTIYAVIRGSAVNNDGSRKSAYTAPSVEGLSQVIRQAAQMAEVELDTIGYIEAHGTGTGLGDPVEFEAMKAAFATDKRHFCRIGSVKTNVGHLETAAGIAGFIKAVLSVKHGQIPPSLFYRSPSPKIDFDNSPFIVNTALYNWQEPNRPRRAGVTSFGIGGSNVHVIIEEYSSEPVKKITGSSWSLLIWSARDPDALERMTVNLKNHLQKYPDIPLEDAAYTLQTGRTIYPHRRILVTANREEAIQQLSQPDHSSLKTHVSEEDNSPLTFWFPGVESYYDDMGRQLKEVEPYFKEQWELCMTGAEASTASVRLFAFQVALARLMISWGLAPQICIGEGSGIYAAKCISGEWSESDALTALNQGAGNEEIDEWSVEPIRQDNRNLIVAFGPRRSQAERTVELVREEGSDVSDIQFLLMALGDLWLYGQSIDWSGVYRSRERPLFHVPLPSYPFERSRFWIEDKQLRSWGLTNTQDTEPETAASYSHPRPGLKAPFQSPKTTEQKELVTIWERLFGIGPLGIQDDFIELGGDSLKALNMIRTVQHRMEVAMPLTEFFKEPTIQHMSQYIAGAERENITPIAAAEKRDFYPLSYIQERMFLLDRMGEHEQSTAYNNVFAFFVDGGLDINRLKHTLAAMIQRHESLRTSFHLLDELPVQRVHDQVDIQLTILPTPQDCQDVDIQTIIRSFSRPFDLSCAPLMRMAIMELSPQRHVMIYDIHHIVMDGSSLPVLNYDFVRLYRKEALEPLTVQYKDFAVWLYGDEGGLWIQKQEKYWLDRLSGQLPVLNLRTDFPRPSVQSFEGRQIIRTLDKTVWIPLRQLITRTESTLYMMLLAICGVLLNKYTGDSDILIGSPVAARDRRELEYIVGVFINAIVMRVFPQDHLNFIDYLDRLKSDCLDAFENQGYPFALLMQQLNLPKDLSRNPIYDFELIVQNIEESVIEAGDLTFTPYTSEIQNAQVDITLEAFEAAGGLVLKFSYCTRLFKHDTMERFIAHFEEVLAAVLKDPGGKLSDIRISHQLESAGDDILKQEEGDFGF